MKIAKSRLKEIINEEYRAVLSEQEIRTVGELRAALANIQRAKARAGGAEAGKQAAMDAAKEFGVEALMQVSGLSAMSAAAKAGIAIFDVVKGAHDAKGRKPKKKTGSVLDKLQIDPEISKIVDDTVEDMFLDAMAQDIAELDDDESVDALDMTKALQKYIAREFDNRTVSTPEN